MVSTIRTAPLVALDTWKTYGEQPQVVSKVAAFALSAYNLISPFIQHDFLISLRAFGNGTKNTIALLYTFTDSPDRIRDFLKSGRKTIQEIRESDIPFWKNQKFWSVVARIAMIVGLTLAVPVYLASAGMFVMPAFLAANIATYGTFTAIDFIRLGLIATSGAFLLYENVTKDPNDPKDKSSLNFKEEELEKAEKYLKPLIDNEEKFKDTETYLKTNEIAIATNYRNQKAAAVLKEKAGIADDSLKAVLFAAMLVSAWVCPISSLVQYLALDCISKTGALVKAYADAKEREYIRKEQVFLVEHKTTYKNRTFKQIVENSTPDYKFSNLPEVPEFPAIGSLKSQRRLSSSPRLSQSFVSISRDGP